MRLVCRRCTRLRGRIAIAAVSGTRPRCRRRQEWKYTGTRDGRFADGFIFGRNRGRGASESACCALSLRFRRITTACYVAPLYPRLGVRCAMHVTRASVRRPKFGRCHWRRWRSHIALRVIQHMAVPSFACCMKRGRCVQRFASHAAVVGLVACASICIRVPCGCSYDGGDGARHRASPVDGRCQRRSAASTSDPAIQRKLAQCASSALHRSCESSNW